MLGVYRDRGMLGVYRDLVMLIVYRGRIMLGVATKPTAYGASALAGPSPRDTVMWPFIGYVIC